LGYYDLFEHFHYSGFDFSTLDHCEEIASCQQLYRLELKVYDVTQCAACAPMHRSRYLQLQTTDEIYDGCAAIEPLRAACHLLHSVDAGQFITTALIRVHDGA